MKKKIFTEVEISINNEDTMKCGAWCPFRIELQEQRNSELFCLLFNNILLLDDSSWNSNRCNECLDKTKENY